MNKRSEPLFQKSTFSPPGSDTFLNFFITPPKTFQLSLGVAGNTDFVSFVTILPIFAAKRPDYKLSAQLRTSLISYEPESDVTKLNNIVENVELYGSRSIVQSSFHQHYNKLLIFCRVNFILNNLDVNTTTRGTCH